MPLGTNLVRHHFVVRNVDEFVHVAAHLRRHPNERGQPAAARLSATLSAAIRVVTQTELCRFQG